ncbi:unnamed protein product [Anisakis simplex]|uniref:AF4/FMR2 family member lilli n=1 Tax=Anisakis simplex TaxID=6269 RepID=A0A0M3KEZ0_ANISI|nr:unnamed protein product [Anisakis simplex]
MTINDLFGDEKKRSNLVDKNIVNNSNSNGVVNNNNNNSSKKDCTSSDEIRKDERKNSSRWKKEEGESPDSGFVDETGDSDREHPQHNVLESIIEDFGRVSPILSPPRQPSSRLPPLTHQDGYPSLKCVIDISSLHSADRRRLQAKLSSLEHATILPPKPVLSPPRRPTSALKLAQNSSSSPPHSDGRSSVSPKRPSSRTGGDSLPSHLPQTTASSSAANPLVSDNRSQSPLLTSKRATALKETASEASKLDKEKDSSRHQRNNNSVISTSSSALSSPTTKQFDENSNNNNSINCDRVKEKQPKINREKQKNKEKLSSSSSSLLKNSISSSAASASAGSGEKSKDKEKMKSKSRKRDASSTKDDASTDGTPSQKRSLSKEKQQKKDLIVNNNNSINGNNKKIRDRSQTASTERSTEVKEKGERAEKLASKSNEDEGELRSTNWKESKKLTEVASSEKQRNELNKANNVTAKDRKEQPLSVTSTPTTSSSKCTAENADSSKRVCLCCLFYPL